MNDVRVYGIADSVVLVRGLTATAQEWMQEHIGSDALAYGDGVAVESRYIGAVLSGMLEAGLSVADGNGHTLVLIQQQQ